MARQLLNRHFRQNIILSLTSLLISLLFAEMMMRLIDPLGVYHYYLELGQINELAIPDDTRAFAYKPGSFDLDTWKMQINSNGNRVVPHAAASSSCRLATIGDSVTFGLGVNDNQTWPDLVAQDLSGVDAINPSKPGYNAANFMPLIKATPATAYVYLAIANDTEPPAKFIPHGQSIAPESALADYLYYWVKTRPGTAHAQDMSGYISDLGDLLTMPNVLIVSVKGNAFNDALRVARPDTVIIPVWTKVISIGDPHPSAAGHREIETAILPHLYPWLLSFCPPVRQANNAN